MLITFSKTLLYYYDLLIAYNGSSLTFVVGDKSENKTANTPFKEKDWYKIILYFIKAEMIFLY